jgi:hypothetical protein
MTSKEPTPLEVMCHIEMYTHPTRHLTTLMDQNTSTQIVSNSTRSEAIVTDRSMIITHPGTLLKIISPRRPGMIETITSLKTMTPHISV